MNVGLKQLWSRFKSSRRRSAQPMRQLHSGGTVTWGLEPSVLEFIEGLITSASVTAETGAGLSTMVFAAAGADHFCVTPSADEIERIRAACQEQHVDDRRVRYCLGYSQDVLPTLDIPELDLAIIDGGHGFPVPFIDWFYLAPRLKVGGILILDDVQIWTSEVLADFMRAEYNWEVIRTFGKSIAFRKTWTGDLADWGGQPYVVARSERSVDWRWFKNTFRGHITDMSTALDAMERLGESVGDEREDLTAIMDSLQQCAARIDALRPVYKDRQSIADR